MRRLTLPDSAAQTKGGRRNAPSAERNLPAITEVLAEVLPDTGLALEIASGTGQHIAAFAGAFSGLTWQPSDVDPNNHASIAAWVSDAPNVKTPITLNACRAGWAQTQGAWDVICLTNLVHLISAREATILLAEVGAAVSPGGVFCLYGPFKQGGALIGAGDVAFDKSLREQDPDIGYKDVEWVVRRLQAAGFPAPELVAMPANNLMVIARRA